MGIEEIIIKRKCKKGNKFHYKKHLDLENMQM